MQSVAVGKGKRRADRNLGRRESLEQPMFIENRFAAPSPWAIKFGDDMTIVLEPNIVDPILESIKGEAMPGGLVARSRNRLQDALGRESEEELTLVINHGLDWDITRGIRHGREHTAGVAFAPPGLIR
jgi:hypothetical protein